MEGFIPKNISDKYTEDTPKKPAIDGVVTFVRGPDSVQSAAPQSKTAAPKSDAAPPQSETTAPKSDTSAAPPGKPIAPETETAASENETNKDVPPLDETSEDDIMQKKTDGTATANKDDLSDREFLDAAQAWWSTNGYKGRVHPDDTLDPTVGSLYIDLFGIKDASLRVKKDSMKVTAFALLSRQQQLETAKKMIRFAEKNWLNNTTGPKMLKVSGSKVFMKCMEDAAIQLRTDTTPVFIDIERKDMKSPKGESYRSLRFMLKAEGAKIPDTGTPKVKPFANLKKRLLGASV
jgi:hypothetical protein